MSHRGKGGAEPGDSWRRQQKTRGPLEAVACPGVSETKPLRLPDFHPMGRPRPHTLVVLPIALSPGPPASLTLGDVLELQALVPSGPSEVEKLAGPTQAPAVGLLVGQCPLQGAGRVVEEVDAQLQVGLPRSQRRAEHRQLQPFAGFAARRPRRPLQHTGVKAAE